ncbi:hypothetical protein KSC_044330 [Ktedonobacter sp. SOSP1-52]|uniref:DUF7694 domain-containing protein n=1 Tax=Ktedonobacter sp. SOSP1-52 TaxID=2778366 RepID=UPI00191517AF|nr:hypothetical protein [Ktedonobacter sp. SOSP1-52]GHO65541.1 hypothetical protein KSC_044330 [Ktedonobacter sp. SOSP1-52]
MKRKKQHHTHDLLSITWTPFVRCEKDPRDPESEIYLNSRYQVHLRRLKANDGGPDLLHLSFRRLDREIFVPYRDKMRIKDELVGPECEGVELFPARSREVDSSNQFHAWIIDDPTFHFPFGFTQRLVTEAALDGARQEPWPANERPAYCLSEEEMRALLQQEKRKRS